MKNLKILGSLFVIFSILFYACTNDEQEMIRNTQDKVELRSSGGDILDLLGNSCVPESIVIPDVCNDVTYIDTIDVVLQDYPGCTFTIVFEYFKCEFQGVEMDLTVGDYQILSHDCQAFSDDVENPYNQNVWSSFIEDFDQSIMGQIQNYLIEEYVIDNERFECGNGVLFNITYTRAGCAKYITAKLPGEINLSNTYKVACGSNCCQSHTLICVDSLGNLDLTSWDVTRPWVRNCDDEPFLDFEPITGRPIWESDCLLKCPLD